MNDSNIYRYVNKGIGTSQSQQHCQIESEILLTSMAMYMKTFHMGTLQSQQHCQCRSEAWLIACPHHSNKPWLTD